MNQVSPKCSSALISANRDLIKLTSEKLSRSHNNDFTIYTGLAGLVTYYLKEAQLGDLSNINKAKSLSDVCVKNFCKKNRVSYLCGEAGLLTNHALICNLLNLESERELFVDRLLSIQRKLLPGHSEFIEDIPDEILYGRTGYLYSLLLLHRNSVCQSKIEPLIEPLINAVLDSGTSFVSKHNMRSTPLMFEWHSKRYYGAAHGVAGILVILMQASSFMHSGALDNLIKPTIDYMASTLFPSGNMPSSENSSSGDRLVQWCHGAPGAVFLFGMAYKCFKEQRYLELAERSAKVVWDRGLLKKGYGLCHGTAGNGYALLFMYQITQEPRYLYESLQFASWCSQYGSHDCSTPDRPYSLFEGLTGTAYFLLDCLHPDQATFPGFMLPP